MGSFMWHAVRFWPDCVTKCVLVTERVGGCAVKVAGLIISV